jgi:RHS repeat-associated protein
VISEFSDASTATYTSGTTPGQAPSDTVALLLYQHHDHMNVRVATDNFGNVAYQHANYPYGDQWYDTGAASTSVRRKLTKYNLEPELTSSALNVALYREHSARMGRFQAPDQRQGNRRIPQRLNRYSYASNDPINRWDPRGTDSCQCLDDCDDPLEVTFEGAGDEGSCDGGGEGGCAPPYLEQVIAGGDGGFEVVCEPPPTPPPCDAPLYQAKCSATADGTFATLECSYGGPNTCCNGKILTTTSVYPRIKGKKYSCSENCVTWKVGRVTYTACCCSSATVDCQANVILSQTLCVDETRMF